MGRRGVGDNTREHSLIERLHTTFLKPLCHTSLIFCVERHFTTSKVPVTYFNAKTALPRVDLCLDLVLIDREVISTTTFEKARTVK